MTATPAAHTAPPATTGGWRIDLLLVVGLLLVAGIWLREWSTQPADRYLYSVAVVDDGTTQLDPYRASLGVDFAEANGHIYSQVPPYQPLLGSLPYALYRWGGGQPFPRDVPGALVRHQVDIGLWMVTLVSATLPAAALLVAMRRYVARTYGRHASRVAVALVWGTVILPFTTVLFGHVLAAFAGFAAWALVRRTRPPPWVLVGAGVLLGLGIGFEFTQAVIGAAIGLYCIGVHRFRAAWVAAGGLVAVIPILVVNARTFGGPFTSAYQGHLPNFQGSGAFGVYNLVPPQPHEFLLALLGDRGLLTLTPIMVLAVIGAVLAIVGRTPARADAILALALLLVFLLMTTGILAYGGSSAGPRYLIPVIPFFALPLAEAWRRWSVLCTATAAWGAFWMVAASATDPLYQDEGPAAKDWLANLLSLRLEPTVATATLGSAGTLALVAGGVALTGLALHLDARRWPTDDAGASAAPVDRLDVAPA